MMRRFDFLFWVALSAGGGIGMAGCESGETNGEGMRVAGEAFGTRWEIVLHDLPSNVSRTQLEDRVSAVLEEIDRQMSRWREDSALSRFNRAAHTEPVEVTEEMAKVVSTAQRVSVETDGAFDITVGPLVDLWGFGPGTTKGSLPDERTRAEVRERVGYEQLVVEYPNDGGAPTIRKKRADLELDLDGIAKGYAVDRIAYALDALGLENYLIEFGGEIRAQGVRPRGGPWRVGLEYPDSASQRIRAAVALGDHALSTAGNYRRFFSDPETGRRYAHIIDPRTGEPARHSLASVTVIAETTLLADAFVTALFVLGPEDGMAIAEANGLAATFLIYADGMFLERSTEEFEPFFLQETGFH